MCYNASSQSWINLIQLAELEKNVKASLLKKSAEFIGSELL